MIAVFWISLAGIVTAYAGYPILLKALSAVHRRPIAKGPALARVSVLIAAHNEEASIEATVRNKLELDYPAELREIIVISDGSEDRTDEIVRRFEERGVRLLVQSPRQGKTAALNWAAREAQGEILVFSDANSMYRADALKAIVGNFSDPSVGYVTGKMIYVDDTGSVIGDGCSAYMKYENVLRDLETRIGSVVGVDGGVDAVRKSLFEPMRPELLPDFVLPLNVVDKGFRVVYEPSAILMEHSLTDATDELRMRVRVILRSFHAMWHKRRLLNPFRAGLFAFQMFFHKVLRYLVGVLQITAFASNAALVGWAPGYTVIFIAQVTFYVLAVIGYRRREAADLSGLFRYPYYLCLLNGASLIALWKFMKGENIAVWKPRKG